MCFLIVLIAFGVGSNSYSECLEYLKFGVIDSEHQIDQELSRDGYVRT